MKNELKILIVILLLIVPIVSALSVDVLKENTIAYHVNSNPSNIGGQQYQGSWYLFPRSAQTEILLDKNHVESSYTADWDGSVYNVDKSQVFETEDVAYAFVYDAVNQKYIQVMGQGTNQENTAVLGDKDPSKYPVIWILPKENINKKAFIRIDKEIMPSISKFTIKEGWNYLFTVPEMLGVEVSEWRGSCDVIKFASWDDEKAEWETYTVNEMSAMFSRITNTQSLEGLAQTFAVKVSNDCSFEVSSSSDVPGFPD